MSKDQSSPSTGGFAITPSDTDIVSPNSRALYVGSAGNVAVLLPDTATPVIFVGVAAGQILPVRATKVMSTGTTAGSILALF